MDKTLIEYIINIIVIVPIIVCLIVISLKLSRKSIEDLHIGAYAQVIEKFSMTKETALYVIRTGETGYVLVSSSNHTEIIKQLSEDEIREVIQISATEVGANSIKEMGKVMTSVKPKLLGKADGKLVSQLVKEYLTNK